MREINDRFTFDDVFRKNLPEFEYDYKETLNYITITHSLGLIPLHERVHNQYYLKINDDLSEDLQTLVEEESKKYGEKCEELLKKQIEKLLGEGKEIANPEVIDEIKAEIKRLKSK